VNISITDRKMDGSSCTANTLETSCNLALFLN